MGSDFSFAGGVILYYINHRQRMGLRLLQEMIRGESLSDSELHEKVLLMRREQPALGQTMVWATLRGERYYVTRSRVRSAITSSDPLSNIICWKDITQRRPYCVPSPNSLWHLGKLITKLMIKLFTM